MMDTPLAAVVHKENVHVGGGKAATMMKPIKLKPAGKERKALADLKSAYGPASGILKDDDLKQKSAMKGSEVKKNPLAQGMQTIAETNLYTTKKHLVTRVSKDAHLNSHSASLGKFGKGNKPLDHILTDEEIEQCYEWANDGIEGMGGYSWTKKDEREFLMNQTLSDIMASAIGVSVAELEQPFQSDEEGYESDEPDMHSSTTFPGRLSSLYTPEELDDPFSVAGIVLDEYPLPELELNEDFNIGIDKQIDGMKGEAVPAEFEMGLANKIASSD